MAMKFLTAIHLGLNELQSAVLENVPTVSLPGGQAGQILYDSTTSQVKYYNGSAWTAFAVGGGTVTSVTSGNSGITIGGTAIDPTVSHADTSSASNLTASARTYVTALTFDDYGHITAYSTGTETVTAPSQATDTVLGTVKLGSATAQTTAANAVTSTASRSYAVQLNASGQMLVNVPWVDTNTTYSVATSTVAGLVELFSDTVQATAANSVTSTAARSYGVQLNAAGQMVVNVPWVDTNTTYSTATSTVAGLVELFSDTVQTTAANSVTTTASRTYGIQLNAAGQAVVNVPWVDTDTNTTYTAGTGLDLTSTTFSLSHLGIQSLVDPNADRVLFWDDSAGATAWLTMGSNLSITGTTLNATDTNTNFYTTAAAFNTTNGELTLTVTGASNVVVDLDGRYLTAEADTLDSVTGRGATTTNAITVGGLTVNGNLTVSGAVTSKISEIVEIEDALITLNSNETGAPTNDSGFVVERGTSANEMFVWDESADEWIVASTTETGTTAGNAVVTSYSSFHAGAIKAGGTLNLGSVVNAAVDTDKFLVLDGSGNVDFRTGAEVLSDIGGQAAGSYITSFSTAGDTGTGSITNGETLTINGSGLISVALVGDTFTVSTTANNYVHPTQTAITQNNSGFTFIQDISVNTLGHVTSVGTGTVTAASESATGVVELATTAEAATGTDTSRAVTAAGVTAAITAREHVATIGDGSSTSIAVTHNLATRDVIVQLYDVSTFDTVYADVVRNTINQVTIDFGAAPASGDIRVLIKAVEI